MVIDLSGIMKDSGGKISVSGAILTDSTEFLGTRFTFPEPLHIDGEIINNSKQLELKATVIGKLCTQCARCTKPIEAPISFKVRELLVRDEETDGAEEDVIVFSGHELDLSDIVMNGFLMNVSGKYLCSEDCKGLCPHCGGDLNITQCDCAEKQIDPRWQALVDIMNKTSDSE